MKHYQSMISLVCSMVLLLGLAPVALGEVPGIMTYQGVLYDSEGRPLDGTYEITAKLYKTATGGTADWTETHSGVLVSKGVFVIMLGRQAPLTTDLLKDALWLGVSVNNGAEMTPRVELASVGTALLARDVLPDSITSDKIKIGQIVKSISGENGVTATDHIQIRGEGEIIVDVIHDPNNGAIDQIVVRQSECNWTGWSSWSGYESCPACHHSTTGTQTRRQCIDSRIVATETRQGIIKCTRYYDDGVCQW